MLRLSVSVAVLVTLLPAQNPVFREVGDGLPGPKVWTEAVVPFDVNGDGKPDLLFANANGWRKPGDMGAPNADPLAPTILVNETKPGGEPTFSDQSATLLPKDFKIHAKNAAVCDLNGDGHDDIAFAVAFGAQQRILLWDQKSHRFIDGTSGLPKLVLNANGVGWGDLDDDGDIDLVWADSGPNSDRAPGGRARMLFNDGKGRFTDAGDRFPSIPKISGQNAELVDIDNDFDLDVIIDGKSPVTQLYLNDGTGRFTLDVETIPQGERGCRTYDADWADLDGDGDLDGVMMNFVGPRRRKLANVVIRNELAETGKLAFTLITDAFDGKNLEDENDFALVDADGDGDLDVTVAVLTSPPHEEKLFLNSGKIGPGFLKQVEKGFTLRHDGSLDMAIADLDGDGRYDAVTGQGESNRRSDFRNRLYRGTGGKDRIAPTIARAKAMTEPTAKSLADGVVVRAWCQDATGDDGTTFVRCKVAWTVTDAGGDTTEEGQASMTHVGGGMHRGLLRTKATSGSLTWFVIATDPMGNESRSEGSTHELD